MGAADFAAEEELATLARKRHWRLRDLVAQTCGAPQVSGTGMTDADESPRTKGARHDLEAASSTRNATRLRRRTALAAHPPGASVPRDRAQNRPAPDMNASAKSLMTLGFKVVPLAPTKLGVDRSGKNPLTEHGVHDATNDFAAFRRLVGSATDFNIGVATGSASGVVVIDVDPRHGGDRAFAKLQQRLGPLPRTLTCVTGGGGWHYYFRLPPGVEMKKKVLAPGVELLAEGSYAVAPPSLHSSGRRYRWAEHRGPRDQAIASLPNSWLQFISASSQARNEPAAADGEAIPEGSRNTELTRIAGQMRRAGLSEADMLAALRGVNETRCRPPLDDGEVAQIARNVAQYPAGAEPRDEGQKIAQALLDAEFAGGRWLRYEADGHFWSWTGTHWAVIPDKILQKKIMTFANGKFSSTKSAKTLVTEVFGLLQIMQAGDDDLLHFASEPPNVVNVLNGELWLRDDGTVEARPHDPATGMRHVLNVSYIPEATCPEYDAAVKRIFEKAEYPQTLIAFFEELMGYAIQLRRDIALIVLMTGGGNNGKTSLIRVLTELVGPDFVHSGRIDDLDERASQSATCSASSCSSTTTLTPAPSSPTGR